MPKRASHIMENIAAEENVRLAILNVNAAHHKRSVCRWVERTLDERVAELQRMVQTRDGRRTRRASSRFTTKARGNGGMRYVNRLSGLTSISIT